MEPGVLEKKIAKLPESFKSRLEGIVDGLLIEAAVSNLAVIDSSVETNEKPAERRPVFGSGKGIFGKMADDFDAPLEDNKLKREFGSLKGFVTYMADDFNAPLEDFKDYM